jgi:hypothetical protein
LCSRGKFLLGNSDSKHNANDSLRVDSKHHKPPKVSYNQGASKSIPTLNRPCIDSNNTKTTVDSNESRVVSGQKQLEDQVTDNGINNEPSWDGSFKPTLIKDEMMQQGYSTKRRLPCTDLTYPKSANTSGLPLRKYQTEEVSNLCTTKHPLARGVGDGAVIHWFVHLDGHDSRGSDDEMAMEDGAQWAFMGQD